MLGTEFLYFTIENAYGFYGPQTIPLKDVGLVNVIGRNLETKGESSSGAGKSRFWRLFQYLFWGKEALAGVAEKKADMTVFSDNFRIEAGFATSAGTFVLRETRNHANTQFEEGLRLYSCPNGLNSRERVPVGPQNDPVALRRYVQALINLTYKEACGTVIWPQNFGHTLIKGKPSERIQWLSDLNGLTAIDEVYDEVAARLKLIRDEIGSLLVYRGEYNAIAEDLAQINTAGDVSLLHARIAELNQCISVDELEIRKQRERVSTVDLRLDKIDRLTAAVQFANSHDLDARERGLAAAGTLVRTFEDQASTVRMELDNLRKHVRNVTRLQQLCEQLAGVEAPRNVQDVQARYADLVGVRLPALRREAALSVEDEATILAERASIEQDMVDLANLLGMRINYETLADAKAKARQESSDVQSDTRTKNAELQKVQSALRLSAGCACPTCMQPVNNQDILRTYEQSLRDDLEALRLRGTDISEKIADFERAENALRYYADSATRLADAKKAAEARAAIPGLEAEVAAARVEIQQANSVQALITERDVLQKAIGDVVVGDDTAAKIAELEQAVSTHDVTRNRYYAAQQAFDNTFAVANELGLADPFAADFSTERADIHHERSSVVGWIDDTMGTLRANIAAREQIRGTLQTHASKTNHLAELTQRINRLNTLEDEQLILTSCLKAYGKTGMKVDRLRSVVGDIAANLPRWTRVLFTEPYFKVRVSPDASGTKLSLMVTKQFTVPGGKTIVKWVDASALSGGEESRFAVCVMLTLSELVASEKRTNLLVLDETDRSCDPYGQRLIADLLIPLMRRSRPSMFVITHQLQLNSAHVDLDMHVTKHENGLTDAKLFRPRR